MADITHRIRRLRWQVRTPGADAAMDMRAMLRELMPDVEAALQQAFDAHGMGEAVRYLARLEVPLRLPAKVTAQGLMQELGSALGQALQQAATEMQPMPWPMQAAGAVAGNPIGAMPFGERGALLCALLALKHHAPQRLHQCLDVAWRDRQQGWAHLTLDGRQWRVDEAALTHWLRWLGGAVSAGNLGAVGDPGGLTAASKTGALGDGAGLAPLNATLKGSTSGVSARHAHHQATGASASDPVQGATPPATLQHLQAQLMHYLRTGQMDWMLAGLPADQARQQLREAAVHWLELGMCPDACADGAPLPDRLGALCRWLSLLSESQRQAVMQRHGLFGQAGADAGRASEKIEAGLSDRAGTQSIRARLIALMRDLMSASSDHLHALALWLDWQQAGGEGMADTALQAWGQAALAWMAGWAQQGPVHDAWQACQQQVSASLNEGRPSAVTTTSTSQDAHMSPDQGVGVGQGVMGDREPAEAQRQSPVGSIPGAAAAGNPARMAATSPHADPIPPSTRLIREPVVSQGHLIAQAGLVLLHPYLARCFNVLGLYPTGQRGPIAEALWPRAASVLHCLVMGDAAEPLECDLGLIKLLLGRGEHDALSHGLPALLPHERDEVAAMLQAVLGHWSALKGTSVEGLRQSFLQRPGWIEPLDRAWQLRVQPAAFDVLLGSLPWGLSMVKLPWMDRPMHVEWSAP